MALSIRGYAGGSGRSSNLPGIVHESQTQEILAGRAALGAQKFGLQQAKTQAGYLAQDRAANQAANVGVGDSMQKMIENYNLAYGEAKTANEARYQQQLGIADQTTGQALTDVRSDFGQRGADIAQQQQRLGMGNTTVGDTLQAGNLSKMQASLARTRDTMQQTKLGIIDKREDQYPDLGSLQSTLAGAASGTVTPQVAAMLKAFGNIRSV
jgi:hypothetical protein